MSRKVLKERWKKVFSKENFIEAYPNDPENEHILINDFGKRELLEIVSSDEELTKLVDDLEAAQSKIKNSKASKKAAKERAKSKLKSVAGLTDMESDSLF